VSAALVNYEVRRQDRLSSNGSTSAEALAVRGRGSYRKAKVIGGDRSSGQVLEILRRTSTPFAKN